VVLRKGDVGGENSFEAAVAFLSLLEATSRLEGESKKYIRPSKQSAPNENCSGLNRRDLKDRMALVRKDVYTGYTDCVVPFI
jgi:hypothetical protein